MPVWRAASTGAFNLLALTLSIAAMVPLVIIANKQRWLKPVFLGAILILALTEFGLLTWHDAVLETGVLLLVFFTAFNLLEATLPSLITRMAPPDAKGTAMGIYSSSQFLGAFAGGGLGGILHGRFGLQGVFAFATSGALIWLLVAWTMKSPRHLSNRLLNVGTCNEVDARHLATRLTQVSGVAEAVVIATEGVAYLKVDRHLLDEAALQELAMAHAQTGL